MTKQIKIYSGNIEGLKELRFAVVSFNPITGRNIVLTKHRDRKFAEKSAKHMSRHSVCSVYAIDDLELVAA